MNRDKIYMVLPTDDYKVFIYYDSGEIRLYDANWILEKGGVFEQIRDIVLFKDLCTVLNSTLAWDISRNRDPYNCVDINFDILYEESVKVRKDSIT